MLIVGAQLTIECKPLQVGVGDLVLVVVLLFFWNRVAEHLKGVAPEPIEVVDGGVVAHLVGRELEGSIERDCFKTIFTLLTKGMVT